MPEAAHPLAQRIHDKVLQLLGSALLQAEMCEQLGQLGRTEEIPGQLGQLRESLNEAVVELRGIMAELRDIDPAALKNRAA
jgi:signal transduction histidine kinase